jgi:aryl sulfotransferase
MAGHYHHLVSEVPPVRYQSEDEDSARWLGFPFRQGDIVISTRSKSGTTWMQMICALLILQNVELPEPLGRLSPWLDWMGIPRDEIYARLEAQEHRRVIKTHTPLDGIPLDPRATYIVVARHPLDTAVSLYHHGNNINRERVRQLTGQPDLRHAPTPRPPLGQWLPAWIDWEGNPREQLDSLPGMAWHATDAWARRHQPNILLTHYADLSADLEGEMHRLARLLDISVADTTWPKLIRAAGFDEMRANAERNSPDPANILHDPSRFFRRGTSGAGHEELTPDALARYDQRIHQLASPEVVSWLHHGFSACG